MHCAAESGSAEALRLLLDAGTYLGVGTCVPCSPDGQGQYTYYGHSTYCGHSTYYGQYTYYGHSTYYGHATY